MNVLVIDVGTSNIRAALVGTDGRVRAERRRATPPDQPMAGLVEFNAVALAETALGLATELIAAEGPVAAVGIANQRASTVVWDPSTGQPVAPALGWQDLRTVGDCLMLAAEGHRLAPNQTATKAAHLLDQVDPDRTRGLLVGTVDTWLVWRLTEGAAFVTDVSNAAVTGLWTPYGFTPIETLLDRLRIPTAALAAVMPSSAVVGPAVALPGAPPIAGIVGDQQASLIGQCCVRAGMAKATFGTGGMLDVLVGPEEPAAASRSPHGAFPIAAWRRALPDGTLEDRWGVEGIMLSAGSNVDWLVDDLGLVSTPADTAAVAASVPDTDGVMYVPALLGLGTPHWDYGARGTLLGLTRGSTGAHVVRAVLEGVAHRGADLLDAVEADTGLRPASLRIDGGMSANPVFATALAESTGLPIEVSVEREATSLGAAYLAGLAVGIWSDWSEVESLWQPASVVEPTWSADRRAEVRARWNEALRRAGHWFEDLSALDF